MLFGLQNEVMYNQKLSVVTQILGEWTGPWGDGTRQWRNVSLSNIIHILHVIYHVKCM